MLFTTSGSARDAGSRTLDNLDPQKTPLTVSEVGRADPDVVKSMFFGDAGQQIVQLIIAEVLYFIAGAAFLQQRVAVVGARRWSHSSVCS
jgi:hypothetical protein